LKRSTILIYTGIYFETLLLPLLLFSLPPHLRRADRLQSHPPQTTPRVRRNLLYFLQLLESSECMSIVGSSTSWSGCPLSAAAAAAVAFTSAVTRPGWPGSAEVLISRGRRSICLRVSSSFKPDLLLQLVLLLLLLLLPVSLLLLLGLWLVLMLPSSRAAAHRRQAASRGSSCCCSCC